MSFKTFMASAFGFTSTAEAAIKADASDLISKAKTLEQRGLDALHEGLASGYTPSVIGSSIGLPVAPPSIVGNTVNNIILISANFGKQIDALVSEIDTLEDELRQRRASRAAAIAALASLADDPAITEDQHTALNLEITDHGEDMAAAAIRAVPTPENEPVPVPAPAPAPKDPDPTTWVEGIPAPANNGPVMRVGFTAKL